MISYAHAKINIGLDIIEKRKDGYHNLETVFYPFPLYDIIEISEKESGETTLEITGLDLAVDADNLCLKAFRLLQSRFDIPNQHIHLHKQIPFGAGLGGGSSDASTLLKMLHKRYSLEITQFELESLAASLGADCPFFMRNAPAYAEGIGTELEDIAVDLSAYYMVLVKPPVSIPTAEAYRHVQPRKPERNLRQLLRLPVQEWKFHVKNDFEESVFAQYPSVRELKLALYALGAVYVSMSGSGSAVFAIFDDVQNIDELAPLGTIYYPVER